MKTYSPRSQEGYQVYGNRCCDCMQNLGSALGSRFKFPPYSSTSSGCIDPHVPETHPKIRTIGIASQSFKGYLTCGRHNWLALPLTDPRSVLYSLSLYFKVQALIKTRFPRNPAPCGGKYLSNCSNITAVAVYRSPRLYAGLNRYLLVLDNASVKSFCISL